MSYTGRARDTIRDQLLSFWAQEYAGRGGVLLLTAPGSDAYLWASALAVMLEGLEAQAESVARDILPDQASDEAIARHGGVDGVARRPGVRASHTVTVAGPANGNYPITAGSRMAYSDGTLYSVDSASVTLSGGGHTGTITVTAVDIGTAGTRAIGDTLTWVSAPTGLNATGAVASLVTSGTALESYSAWAQRIIARRQERPASGNRADWQDWVERYTGTTIARAYVYPLLAPPASYPGAGTPDTPGCVTVVAVGPAQGDELVHKRVVPLDDDGGTRTAGAALPLIRGYIEGNYTIAGEATTDGTMLRPVTMVAANAAVEAISEVSQNVVLSCAMTTANDFPWTGAQAIILSTDTTIKVTGDYTALSGKRALVLPATPTARGGYRAVTLGPSSFSAGDTTFTQATGQEVGFPVGSIYPCPPNWETIRTDVFAHFDALGPGDTTPASRWPSEDVEARATLYRTGLAADVINGAQTPAVATGVLSCTVTTPAADVTPAAKTVVTLGTLLVTP